MSADATSRLREAFDDVAPEYDLMVGLIPGYHAQLVASAREFVRSLTDADGPGTVFDRPLRIVDLGCGSGASTGALVQAFGDAGLRVEIIGVDVSAGMLESARRKKWPAGVRFVQGTAEQVARGEVEGLAPTPDGFDGVFAAYLLRNVPEGERDAFLAGLYARLRPGAPVLLHDYSVAGQPVATAAWTALCWGVIVPLSVALTRRPGLFTYLWRSVLEFDSVVQTMARLQRAGYSDVRARGMPGWQSSMVHMVHGRRS